MDLSKLSNGDKIIGVSGLLLLIFSFLPWFKLDFGNGLGGSVSSSINGWDYFFTGIVPTLLGLLLVAYVVVTKMTDGVKLPDLPVGYPLVVLGLAGLAALLIILRLLIGADASVGSDFIDRAYGLFLATIAGIGLAAGAFLKFQEDGGEFSTKSGGSGTSGTQSGGDDGGAPTPF